MQEKRFAVLIDGDNNSKNYIKTVIDEISNEGVITYKRMYGDWTDSKLRAMKKIVLEYSITPMQQYSYTAGKNSTDSAMIIDAMDILYTGKVDGFCLVSSDSDFTKLASRLREAGMYVIGMGKTQTPKSFVAACNKFKFLDLINKDVAKEINKIEETESTSEKKVKKEEPEENSSTPIEEVKKTITKIIDEYSDDDGWVLISRVGNLLANRYSDFDCRNYGYKKMADFLKASGFAIKKIKDVNNKKMPTGYVVYVSLKKKEGKEK